MEKQIPLKDKNELYKILGVLDKNIRFITDKTGARIHIRNGTMYVLGSRSAVETAHTALLKLKAIVNSRDVTDNDLSSLFEEKRAESAIKTTIRTNKVQARSEGQKFYLDEIGRNDIVLCIGPAGTGKTFLAVNKAVDYLASGQVRRVVLVRPAVEAGEKLGFLPGDIIEKVNPYLRPVYDALNHFLAFGQLRRLIDEDIIEIVPLAFMRGRTLDEAFIILDEAQNTTSDQMKMFLTRMGERSKIVVTGDITQIDLPPNKMSGLVEAKDLLKDIPGISFVFLSKSDIVRHPLVQKVIERYEKKKSRL